MRRRLFIVVEGQTEEAFCKDVLVPHLATCGVDAAVTIVQTRDRRSGALQGQKGGAPSFSAWVARLEALGLAGGAGEPTSK